MNSAFKTANVAEEVPASHKLLDAINALDLAKDTVDVAHLAAGALDDESEARAIKTVWYLATGEIEKTRKIIGEVMGTLCRSELAAAQTSPAEKMQEAEQVTAPEDSSPAALVMSLDQLDEFNVIRRLVAVLEMSISGVGASEERKSLSALAGVVVDRIEELSGQFDEARAGCG